MKNLMRYSRDPNTELVWYSNGRKEVEHQKVWHLNAIWISNSPTIWILDEWTPSCFLMYWFGIQMVCIQILTVYKFKNYSGDVRSRLVRILNGRKRLVCKWSGSEIRKPNHLKSRQMGAILSKTISNVWDYSYSHSLSPTIWNPTFKKSWFQTFLYFIRLDFKSPL